MWPTCKNKQKDQIICKPIGYVITACSGLGYCQIDFSENLSFEKYVDILCLLPLRQTVCSSLQHAAGCAACQQRCNVLQISAPGKAMVAATVKRIETSSSWLPSCFPEIFLHPQTEGLQGGMPSLPPCLQLNAGLA